MSERRTGIALGAGLTGLVLALYLAGGLEWLELRSYDLRFALTPPYLPATPVLLVRIDEASETELNARAIDIRRSHYAAAVRNLARAGATLIAFDVIFSRPQAPAEDDAFADAIAEAGNVILARYIGERGHKLPLPAFREGELSEALINVALDSDGVLREMPLLGFDYAGDAPEPVLALALDAARLHLSPRQEQELDLEQQGQLGLGSLRIPYPDGRMRINFYGPPGVFPRMSFSQAVKNDFDPGQVRGRIVVIGSATPSLHDDYQTPYTDKLVMTLTGALEQARGVRMDGYEIHAHAIQTILDRRFIARSRDREGLVPALVLILGGVGTLLLLQGHRSGWFVLWTWATAIAGLLAMGWVLFTVHRYWLDIVPLTVLGVLQFGGAIAFQRYLESRKRRQVEAMFGRYVSTQVVERLVRNPELANPGGRKERLSILFSDVRGFTAMSERMEPQDVQQLLSHYFTEMTRILFKHGGTLDKFMGDAIMAFFGNPEPQADHARRAIATALAMQQSVEELNRRWAAEGRSTIGVGIGINTGEVTVGNLGSTEFLDYTVIGDAVNLACRLEQHAGPGEILISESTYLDVKDELKVEFREPIRVKGKRELVAVYRVLTLYDGPLIG